TQVLTATSWSFTWTPCQSVGTYVATATVFNPNGCTGTAASTWTVVIPPCASCATIVQSDPTPTGGSPRYYRQQNQINDSCSYPLNINAIAIRARSICATCPNPLKLQKVQYIQSGSFPDETSNVVYTAAGSGDDVSTIQTA